MLCRVNISWMNHYFWIQKNAWFSHNWQSRSSKSTHFLDENELDHSVGSLQGRQYVWKTRALEKARKHMCDRVDQLPNVSNTGW